MDGDSDRSIDSDRISKYKVQFHFNYHCSIATLNGGKSSAAAEC